MLRDRLLVRSAAMAAIVTASSLSLVTAAGAETPAVALVGQSAPQIEAGDALDGTADAASTPVAPPTEVEPLRLDTLSTLSFLPAADVATTAETSNLSTVVLLAGLALLALGSLVMVSGSWHRVARSVHSARARLVTAS